jgi:hypothetical protein
MDDSTTLKKLQQSGGNIIRFYRNGWLTYEEAQRFIDKIYRDAMRDMVKEGLQMVMKGKGESHGF